VKCTLRTSTSPATELSVCPDGSDGLIRESRSMRSNSSTAASWADLASVAIIAIVDVINHLACKGGGKLKQRSRPASPASRGTA
jgi:hypothetical protein